MGNANSTPQNAIVVDDEELGADTEDGTMSEGSLWLEEDAAAAEVAALAAMPPPDSPTTLARGSASPTTLARLPASPQLVPLRLVMAVADDGSCQHLRGVLGSGFETGRDVHERRWNRLRAHPATFGDLPEELYSRIFVQANIESMASLSLCSKAWNSTAAAAMRSEAFWWRAFDEFRNRSFVVHAKYGRCVTTKFFSSYYHSMVKLLSTVLCRCDGPAACVEYLTDASRVSRLVELGMQARVGTSLQTAFRSILYYDGAKTLTDLLSKVPRQDEWTAEMVTSCLRLTLPQILAPTPYFTNTLEDASLFVDDVCEVVNSMRAKGGDSFSVAVEDVHMLMVRPEVIGSRDGRSVYLMEAFGSFYDYCFDDAAAIRLASAVAALRPPSDDILDLIAKLNSEEAEAEAEGMEHDPLLPRESTRAFVRTWAEASSFPSAWPLADQQAFFIALSESDAGLKSSLASLVLSWARAALAPAKGETPAEQASVDLGIGMLAALQ